jgi:decaprenyl-phosphate phosphoribosyltransferase
MAVYPQLNNLVLVAPVIIAAVLVYFHHAMKEEAARLEPEQLLQNPWIIVCTLGTATLTLWLLLTPTPYAKLLHLLGPLKL